MTGLGQARLVDLHPALFQATASINPADRLVDYGVLGIVAAVLIYAVKKLYDAISKSYDLRLADKDAIIADKDATIAKQDTIIAMFIQNGQQAVPALQRTAQVIEAQAKAVPPPATLQEVGEVLPRVLQILERLESHADTQEPA